MATDDAVIDARGLKCPLPVLKLEKRLATSRPGSVITVLTTDPMAKIDIPLHCRQNGHACGMQVLDGAVRFEITKGGVGNTPAADAAVL